MSADNEKIGLKSDSDGRKCKPTDQWSESQPKFKRRFKICCALSDLLSFTLTVGSAITHSHYRIPAYIAT